MSGEQPEVVPEPWGFIGLAYPVWKAAIFKAGVELRVWEHVAAGRCTSEQIARHAGWDGTETRKLLDALCGMQLLRKQAGAYALVPLAEHYLLPERPSYVGDIILALLGWSAHDQLAEVVRTGRRPRDLTGDDMDALWAGFFTPAGPIAPSSLEARLRLWSSVGIQATESLQVLDVACGSALTTLAFARQHPGVHITLIDRPHTLAAARQVAELLGVATQVTAWPGDLRTIAYGEQQFDVVYFGNIMSYFSMEELAAIFRKTRLALKAGGVVVLNTDIPDAERCQKEDALVFGMEISLLSAGGDAYTLAEYRSVLEQTGFTDVTQVGDTLIRAVAAA